MKKTIIISLKIIGISVLLLSIFIWAFLQFDPVFGADLSKENMERYKLSTNFDGTVFKNKIPTKIDTRDPQSQESMLTSILNLLAPEQGKIPSKILPSKKFFADSLINNSFVWFGHSTVLMNISNMVILTDPVFYNASPVPGTVKPFKIENPITIKNLPKKIDVVLISHDHYDHLDYKAIVELEPKVSAFYVPLGIKAHLLSWGVPNHKIIEQDWGDSTTNKLVTFTTTPARHFSGRGLSNRYSTLWCSWVISSENMNVFFNGDSGYFEEYKVIGETYGPFDISFMENGAYDKNWAEIHMLPEESIQAAIDLNSKLTFPIHWGKFDLANHKWKDPIIRASKESELKNMSIATLLVGQIFTLENVPQKKWWEAID